MTKQRVKMGAPRQDPGGEKRDVRITANFTRSEAERIAHTGVSVRELVLQALESYE